MSQRFDFLYIFWCRDSIRRKRSAYMVRGRPGLFRIRTLESTSERSARRTWFFQARKGMALRWKNPEARALNPEWGIQKGKNPEEAGAMNSGFLF